MATTRLTTWLIVGWLVFRSALECSARWVTSYYIEDCRARDGRLGFLVEKESSEYEWTLIEGPRRTGNTRTYRYWLDVDYESVWAKPASPARVQPLFRSGYDGSHPSVITAEPTLLAWASRWEKLNYFDIGKRSWTTVQEAPPGEFMHTGVYGGSRGALTWTKGDDLCTYDFGTVHFRRVGHVPQCKAEFGDERWCCEVSTSARHEQRRAVVIGSRTLVWSEEFSDVTTAQMFWYDVSTGVLLGKLLVPPHSSLRALAWNGTSLVFAFRDASGTFSIATETGFLPSKQQMGTDLVFYRMLLSTAPPALLAINTRDSSEGRGTRQWEIREWRYMEGLYRTGTLSVATGDLNQPDKRFIEPCKSEPYSADNAKAGSIPESHQ